MKIGIMCHMYHSDLFEQLKSAFENVRGADLHLTTTTDENADKLAVLFKRRPAYIYKVPNRGRDIAPKLITLGAAHDDYDLVLHLHTKRSIPEWLDHILKHLAGSRRIVSKIIAKFERERLLGVIAAPHYGPIEPWIRWGGNKPTAVRLASRMGIEASKLDPLDFPSGSMFWARPAAIRPLLDLGLTIEDFPKEPTPDDGTIGHAIERLFYIAAEHAGFSWHTVPQRRAFLDRFRGSTPSEQLLRVQKLIEEERLTGGH
jgi:lipopolysaccharide biosynthesis protein